MTGVGGRRLFALTEFTTRGQTFLATGITTGIGALALGQEGLLRVAVLLLALPVVFALILGGYQDRMNLIRSIDQARATPGSTVRVELGLENRTFVASKILLAQEQIPEQLGPSPRFVLDRLPGRSRLRIHYTVTAGGRGRYLLGPLTFRMTDPLGMSEVTRAFTTTTPLIVPPRTWPLAPAPLSGGPGHDDRAHGRSLLPVGADDGTVREYRNGDDIRRLHWRSTARRGQLMVRQEEQPQDPKATVLLDCRPGAHHGAGQDSSFEWAVSAVASAALVLTRQGRRLHLIADTVPDRDPIMDGSVDTQPILDRFAEVSWQESDSFDPIVTALSRAPRSGLLLAVLGELSVDQADVLARTAARSARRWAVLLRPRQHDVSAAPTGFATTGIGDHDPTPSGILRAAGWTVTQAHRHESVVTVWDRLLGRPAPVPSRTAEQPS
jgi:uncharacterized protein (DUF58 family)